jgi:cysteine sulfinate desulfinase/cysteine desulfurase-like protein
MGLTRDEAFGTLRVSFGAQNTAADVARFLAALQAVVRDY